MTTFGLIRWNSETMNGGVHLGFAILKNVAWTNHLIMLVMVLMSWEQ
jgi:hypothetical protein